jgi:ABC-type multidrug transport system fused ATPase/permease subunit
VRLLLRCLADNRVLWRVWWPRLVLAVLLPPLAIAVPLVEKYLIDEVVLAKRLELLPWALALYGGLWLLTTLVQLVGTPLRAYLGERLTMLLRQRLFAHCQLLSIAFSQREHSGRTMSLLLNDVPVVTGLFSATLLGGVASLVTLAFGILAMFSLNWQLAVATGVLPPLVAAVAAVVTRPLRPAARRAQEKLAELSEQLHENLVGLREVVAFGRGSEQGQRLAHTMGELLRLRMRVTMIDTTLGAGQNFFSLAVTLVIIGYGGYLIIQDQTTFGTVIAMRTLFSYVFQPAGQLAGLVSSTQKALASVDRVYGFLDQTPQVQERLDARTLDAVAGAVTFDRVSFAYSADRAVLQDVSFASQPGEVVALVGPSGAGKSTLMSLLTRFYDPTVGRVLLDGVDLRDLRLEWLRSQIGIVFQDTFLFASTIGENIGFGRAGASEREIVAAARAANAWEFIEHLPDGLGTSVGERGVQLSEGQKQRLAIARALLRDPRILILDEPTSALDARSEHLLQTALENLMRGRTTFVVAHRLATVQRADRILVVDDGRIVEQGTHAELLQHHGLYRELFELQFGDRGRSTDRVASRPSESLVTA